MPGHGGQSALFNGCHVSFRKKNQPTNNNENFVESCTVWAAAELMLKLVKSGPACRKKNASPAVHVLHEKYKTSENRCK